MEAAGFLLGDGHSVVVDHLAHSIFHIINRISRQQPKVDEGCAFGRKHVVLVSGSNDSHR